MLNRLARAITGDTCTVEPFLYLWGICPTEDAFDPMELLIAARKRFESDLPVERPLHGARHHAPSSRPLPYPDRGQIHQPQHDLRPGPTEGCPVADIDELLEIYHDPCLQILDYDRARMASQVHYQLWRNMTFSEWMAREDHRQTKAFHVNLVREGFEKASAADFHKLVNPDFTDRFRRLTWESIYRFFVGTPALSRRCASTGNQDRRAGAGVQHKGKVCNRRKVFLESRFFTARTNRGSS